MTPKTESEEEKGSSGLTFVNDPPENSDIDETPEYPLPSPTNPLNRDQRPPNDDASVEQVHNQDVKHTDVEVTTEEPETAGSE